MASSRKLSPDGLRRVAAEQAALRRVAMLVARGVEPDLVFAVVAEEVSALFNTDLAMIARLELDGELTVIAFPGLGTATSAQNTDQRPVTLTVPLTALRTIDEYPYQAAIAAGVKLVLVSWAIYPALDPARPAGLSPAIVGGELRQRLGFTGVTITDALEAGALQPFGTIGQRATLAAQAGMDLILCSAQQATEGDQAKIALENGYQDGTLGQAAFQAALQRVLALKSSLAE
jgi:beta-glucosidase-like glycosyl hydrolase